MQVFPRIFSSKIQLIYNAFSLPSSLKSARHRGGVYVSPRWCVGVTAVAWRCHRSGVRYCLVFL